MGFGIVVPILAFCAKEYGASGATLGMILASFSLMQFLFSPIWGRLSDRIGRRPVLMTSLLGSTIGFVIFAFASSVALLFASRILSGIASASISTAQAYVADTTDESNRSKGMALIGMAFGLGLVLGPPIGGLLSTVGHYAPNVIPGIAAALLSATALLMAIFFLPESSTHRSTGRWALLDHESWSMFFRTRGLRLAGGSLAVLMFTLASLAPILVLIGRDDFALTSRQVGYLFGLMGVVVVIVQWLLIERFTKRIGDLATGIVGAVALIAGLLLVPFTIVVATCLMGVGQGFCNPTLSAYISKVAPPEHRGGILGVSTSLNALARVIGPPLAGFAYDAFRAPGALLSQAAVVIVGIALSIRALAGARESRLP